MKSFQHIFIASLLLCVNAFCATYDQVGPGVEYAHITNTNIPWSIHVVKFDEKQPDLSLVSSLSKGTIFGLRKLRKQVESLPKESGTPIAAINADFFLIAKNPYQGEPRGLLLRNGELVTSPTNNIAFWIDRQGKPELAQVKSKVEVIWPNHKKTAVVVNKHRANNAAALLTPTLGPSTRTTNGLELVLERDGDSPWLSLKPGQTYSARVREIRSEGDTPLKADIMVLSVGPKLAARIPKPEAGMVLKISTALSEDFSGVQTAISGGPVLLAKGKRILPREPFGKPDHMHERNPRTALGWNAESIFFVVVDGRKKDLSVGMTFPELTDEMQDLGCTDAVNLDGGGSTTLWLSGKVVNHPSEAGVERDISDALILVRKEAAK